MCSPRWTARPSVSVTTPTASRSARTPATSTSPTPATTRSRDYEIGADGTLSDIGATPGGGNQPTGLGFTPDGEYLLATNRDSSDAAPSISVFSVANNGALTLVPSSPVSIGIWDPRGVVVSPDGRFVYVTGRRGPTGPPASNADTAIAALTISPDGSLHTIAGSPLYLPGQINRVRRLADPGRRAPVRRGSNSDKIHAMNLDQTTGAPSAMAGSPFRPPGIPLPSWRSNRTAISSG